MSMDSTASAADPGDDRPKSVNELFDEIERFAVKLAREVSRRLVGRLGLSVSDAKDIEQELLTHLVQKLPQFDPSRARPTTDAAQ
ncbi:MAG: hypothetical protein WEB58_19880 [Planctomycetaceae bacterium]